MSTSTNFLSVADHYRILHQIGDINEILMSFSVEYQSNPGFVLLLITIFSIFFVLSNYAGICTALLHIHVLALRTECEIVLYL